MSEIHLTADLCAQAIVAAARVYDVDPLRWAEVKRGPSRSALIAAAVAVEKITGRSRKDIAAVFGCPPTSLWGAEHRRDPFSAAVNAAWSAVDVSEVRELEAAIRATPPAAIPTAPEPAKIVVDHTAAIKAAMARRRVAAVTVVGVEKDRAALGGGAGGCHWPLAGTTARLSEKPCQAEAVSGRLFCADHCRAVGQKDTPVELAPAVFPTGYRDPRAFNAVGRASASK